MVLNYEVEETCTTDGYKVYKCSKCGAEETKYNYGSAYGHKFNDNGYCSECDAIDPDYDFKYTIKDNEVTITGYKGSGGDIEIPSTIYHCPVVHLGKECFYKLSNINSIELPDSVLTIGDYAFYECDLSGGIYFGKNLLSIGDCAFSFCGLKENITLPNSLTSIGDDAFEGCTRLTSVIIPDSVTSIGDGAFFNCSSLTSVTIPNGVTSIGNGVFEDCTNLTSIIIPDSVTSIGDNAFMYCNSLTNVTIPDSVTYIGGDTFSSCEGLTSVTIGDGVTHIGGGAFAYCANLVNVNFGNSLNYIGSCAFEGCGISSVVIPSSVNTIEEKAFRDCTNLKTITISSNTQIGDAVFGYDLNNISDIFFKGTLAQRNANSSWKSSYSSSLNKPRWHYSLNGNIKIGNELKDFKDVYVVKSDELKQLTDLTIKK